jgi:hypothetical protein
MAELTHLQYDALERALVAGTRIVVYRRGTEYVVVPTSLQVVDGREAISARHPTTGEAITFYIDEVDSIDVVR